MDTAMPLLPSTLLHQVFSSACSLPRPHHHELADAVIDGAAQAAFHQHIGHHLLKAGREVSHRAASDPCSDSVSACTVRNMAVFKPLKEKS